MMSVISTTQVKLRTDFSQTITENQETQDNGLVLVSDSSEVHIQDLTTGTSINNIKIFVNPCPIKKPM